jgi:hypothetical protein
VLYLKDAFFCIPLHPDSQPLFAFEDPTNLSQQLIWTVLPQGFRDSPHLFGQALTKDLLDWQYPGVTHLQYVDDLPLCESTEPLVSRATESHLNLLASQGYKVVREKAQLCLPQVTYLGMFLEGKTNSLSPEWIKPILGYILPQTLCQVKDVLGITGFGIWILGYADLARLLKEAQENSQSYLEWDPDSKKAFQTLKQALQLALALSLPTQDHFHLYV